MVCKMGCASARTGTHAGTATVPPDCCYPDGLPCSSLSIVVEQKKQGKKPCFFLLERITRLARCASARTGTHAGTATVPRTVATLTGCPVRVLQYCRTKKARQKALLFYWSGLRDSPGALLRAPARTRAPQQSPGLLLSWRIALFESLNNCRTKKARQKALLFFIGADYETRTRYLHLGKVALYQMS